MFLDLGKLCKQLLCVVSFIISNFTTDPNDPTDQVSTTYVKNSMTNDEEQSDRSDRSVAALSYSDDILNSDNNFLVIAQNIRNDVSICKIVDKIITDPESGEIVCSNCGMVITDKVEDALKKVRDVKDIGHYSSGNTEITIKDRNEISYSLSIIKQAYEKS
jgi:hypothetical protein